jgi:RNA polymerase sigma-70 factor (sigma-E family)
VRAHDGEYAEFVGARGTALLRTAHLLARGPADAEDLLQTALVKTYLSWHRLRDVAAAEAYTRRVLVNTSISWWRLRRNRDEQPAAYLPDQHVEHPAAELGERAEMIAALRRISPQQRAVLVLRFYEDLSEAQIADTLGLSRGTVKAHTSRGLARLRELLGGGHEIPAGSEEEAR